MTVARLFSIQCSLTRNVLFKHLEIPSVSSVAWKQSLAENLGLPAPPKRPLSPYLRYMKTFMLDNKAKFPSLTHRELFQKASQQWRYLTQDDKNKWAGNYEKEREQYAIRYKEYLRRLTPNEVESLKHLRKKQLQDKAKKQANREKKRESESLGKPKYPGNAFLQYIQSLPRGDATYKDFLISAASSWNKLPENSQRVYREKAQAQLIKYYKSLSSWEEKMMQEGREDLVRVSQRVATGGGRGGESKTRRR